MQIKTASVISTGLHVLVLAWATLSFNSKPFETTPAESLPVDIISEKEFSQLTKGQKDVPKPVETPKPVVEKKAEEPPKPVEELKPKIDEKKEVAPNKEVKQEAPPPEPTPDKPKPQEKPPEKVSENANPTPMPPRKPPPPKPPQKKPEFNPDKIAALLDKRDPTRKAVTGARHQLNAVARHGNGLPPRNCRNRKSTRCGRGFTRCGIRPPAPRTRARFRS